MNEDILSPYEISVKRGTGVGKGRISPENMPIMHDRLMEIAIYFDAFCMEHHLTYCLVWGSCIGAVRHHGFIPWDDDMDIAMPRSDYERLFDLWDAFGDKEHFSIYRTTEDSCANVPIALLRSKNTTVIYDFCQKQDITHGVKIDIEAFDVMPEGRIARFLQYVNFRIYEVYSTQRLPKTSPSLRKYRQLKLFIVKAMLFVVPTLKGRYKIAQSALIRAMRYNNTQNEYVRCNAVSAPIRKDDLFNTIRVDYAGHKLCIPKGYDAILRQQLWYGDYMQKPPVEARVPGTDYIFYDLNTSYEKYRGIKYLFDN